jgi:site-specific recombinase XerD
MGKIKSLRSDIVRTPEGKLLMIKARDPRVKYLLAMLIGYGKRVSEVLALDRSDLHVSEDGFIVVRFKILKSRPKSGIMKIRTKRLSLDHWCARPIIQYVQYIEDGYLLPSYGKTGHITRQMARHWLKALDKDVWPHLFRHSLATMMAENGATAFELKAYFDWDDIRTAQRYVLETEALSEKWAERVF